MIYVVTVAGFALLLGGAELLLRGAVRIAELFGVPTMVIGMTVVAFGTSTPEFLVALNAAAEGASDVALGNLIGSNTANILLILGATVLAAPIAVAALASRADAMVLLIATGVFVALSLDGRIGRFDGAALIVVFVGFVSYSIMRRRIRGTPRPTDLVEHYESSRANPWAAAALTVVGLAGLVAGGNLVVESAIAIARQFGVSGTVIGLTLVAVGTSVPELAASLYAAVRGQPGVAIGNIVGSNIFNCTGIVGFVAAVSPLPVPGRLLQVDLWTMVLATLLLAAYVTWARRLERVEGVIFVGLYVAYIAMIATGIDGVAAR